MNFQSLQAVQVLTDVQEITGKSAPDELREQFKNIFPSFPIVISTILAFILAFLFLHYLFYKPIKRYVKARQNYIQDNINVSELAKNQADASLQEASYTLSTAHKTAHEIINKAKIQSQEIAVSYIEQAKKQQAKILEDANRDLQRQIDIFEQNKKEEVLSLAIELAKKIIKKEIDPEEEARILAELNLDN